MLVRGNIILCEELTSEGQVKWAVTLASMFFWRFVLTSKMASILQGERKGEHLCFSARIVRLKPSKRYVFTVFWGYSFTLHRSGWSCVWITIS